MFFTQKLIDSLADSVLSRIEDKMEEQNKNMDKLMRKIEQQDQRLSILETTHGPKSFIDALSPSAITGAPTRHINPAYQE